jgi:hypothetical protein
MNFKEWLVQTESYEEELGVTKDIQSAFNIAEKHFDSMEALGIVDEKEFSTGRFASTILPEDEGGKRQMFDNLREVGPFLTQNSTKFRVLWKPIPAGGKVYQTIVIVHY